MLYPRHIERKLSGRVSQDKVRLLFGARQVGKTVLLKRLLPEGRSALFNLQDSTLRRRFERDPAAFAREVRALPRSITHIGVDEIQKVPPLFDEVQNIVDDVPGRFQFFLTGSSARKLRTGTANLLPGRCHVYHLFPVARFEEESFRAGSVAAFPRAGAGFPDRDLDLRLMFGDLPGVSAEPPETAAATLDGYVENYVEEEIRREALVKDLGAFASFVRLAAVESGMPVNLAGVSRESGVPAATVKTYYQVLVDTFVAHWVPSYKRSARKKLLTTPRFLMFDLGVRNAAAGLPFDTGMLAETGGRLLEHWAGLELVRRARCSGRGHDVSFWRAASGAEVDFVWESPTEDVPIEVKWTDKPRPSDARHLETFLDLHPSRTSRGLVVCRAPAPQQLTDRVTAIPWHAL